MITFKRSQLVKEMIRQMVVYQQDSRVLYTFVPDKSFGQLVDISPKTFIFFTTCN